MKLKEQNMMTLTSRLVHKIPEGEVWAYQLENRDIKVVITNLGGSIVSVETPDKHGVKTNIVSGYSNLLDYRVNPDYFGCTVGRYANRIANGQFQLDGRQYQLNQNNDGNHLHGGIEGFNKKIWKIISEFEQDNGAGVEFEYISGDGEEGYPGALKTKLRFSLNNQNQLSMIYEAETDKATPVNFTNHSYFNLSGFDEASVKNHYLQINATCYTEKNQRNLPTGRILPVAGTPLDFRNSRRIGDGIDQFPMDFGYDHNFVLQSHPETETIFAAKLCDPESGRSVRVYTTQPGIQVYTANYWNGTIKGSHKNYYQKHGAVALETQSFPDSPNHSSFPNTILHPGEKYKSQTVFEFAPEKISEHSNEMKGVQ